MPGRSDAAIASAKLAGGIVRAVLLSRRRGWPPLEAYGWSLADQATNILGQWLLFGVLAMAAYSGLPPGPLRTGLPIVGLIVTIADPLGIKANNTTNPPLLIGEIVEVAIEGGEIENAFRIPRRALRDQDQIWMVKNENQLDIRPITIAWRDEKTVIVVKGLKDGEQIVISDLSTPVAGMKITVASDSSGEIGSRPKAQSQNQKLPVPGSPKQNRPKHPDKANLDRMNQNKKK